VSLPVFRLIAVVLLGVAVALSRRAPAVAAAMPGVLSLVLSGSPYNAQLMPAELVLAYLLGRRTGGRRATLGLVAVLAVLALVYAVIGRGGSASDWFLLTSNALAMVVLPWCVGQYVRQLAELRDAGWELAERLELEQDRVAGQVRLRERARIASDMHDSLGHELSLIAIRAAGLEVTAGIGPEGRQAAAELRRAAESATDRLRQIIGMLREDGDDPPVTPSGDVVPTGAAVRSLVQRAAGSGVTVTLTDSIGEGQAPIPVATAQAVYRVVQEALTNAAKHAPGAAVDITLRVQDDQLVVEVVNATPPSRPPRSADGGYGLVGLDERVRLVGGSLQAQPTDDGFAVTARLPLAQDPAVTPALAQDAAVPASRQALDTARRRLRRSLVDTFWPPAVLVVVLLLLFLLDAGR
jgi:signal transduction histidine kinase